MSTPTGLYPLPWRFDMNAPDPGNRSYAEPGECVVAADGEHVICSGHYYEEGGYVDPEIARRIVRAVNSHAALVAACKEFVRKCECGEARSKRSYAEMKAALALAEGK